MNIITNIDFGLGYFDPTVDGIVEVSDIKLKLYPFEVKQFTFYIYGTSVVKDKVLSVIGSLEELNRSKSVKVSFTDKSTGMLTNTDNCICIDGAPVRLLVEVTNTLYTELNCNLRLDISLLSQGDRLEIMDYYGPLVDNGDYKQLSRPVETEFQRRLIINPVPAGAIYTYLAYSGGNNFILLPNNIAIQYQKNLEE